MSYLALARKWRPRTFAELVGQEHVVTALRNALDTGRVHHAFLFTGTRGVGKTTIARIFAKSLNCQEGVSSEPCGHCPVCVEVDAGRFVDLIEIDAASNTGVDDVRELIDSAQIGPARGRHKVFLVDEVHMLSKNAFNALLKTLEEPPGHVKFLLATTDPQKLPVTVLSRCLQFNLRRLRTEEIGGQMRHILAAEGIDADDGALALLAHAADGSMRDGLSLLDQAIAHGGGALRHEEVRAMLGTLDQDAVLRLIEAVAAGDAPALFAAIESVAGFAADYVAVLADVARALHRVQLQQLLPGGAPGDGTLDPARLTALARTIAPEDVQLYYQIATQGTRDMTLAPTPRIGLEMALLRMLAFRPEAPDGGGTRTAPPRGNAAAPAGGGSGGSGGNTAAAASTAPHASAAGSGSAGLSRDYPSAPLQPAAHRVADAPRAAGAGDAGPSAPVGSPSRHAAAAPPAAPGSAVASASVDAPAAFQLPRDTAGWVATLDRLGIRAAARMLADNCIVIGERDGAFVLGLGRQHEILLTDMLRRQIEQALCTAAGTTVRLRIQVIDGSDAHANAGAAPVETPAQQADRMRQHRQSQAEQDFMADPGVRAAIDAFDAQVVPGSIRPR
jgi:DNA polymerase-3 subunit gamma/tau